MLLPIFCASTRGTLGAIGQIRLYPFDCFVRLGAATNMRPSPISLLRMYFLSAASLVKPSTKEIILRASPVRKRFRRTVQLPASMCETAHKC